MLAITIEHAVTKPMVRFGRVILTELSWVSVAIRWKFLSYFRTPISISQKSSSLLVPRQMFAGRCFYLPKIISLSCQMRSTAQFASSMNAHPKLSVETATQLAVFLANRPGALARVCDALADA